MKLLHVSYGLLAGMTLLSSVMVIPLHSAVMLSSFLLIHIGVHHSLERSKDEDRMSKNDAYKFPIMGSAVLFSLYLAVKFVAKWVLTMLLTAYFSLIAIGAVSMTVVPFAQKLGLPKKKVLSWDFSLPLIGKLEGSLDCAEILSILVGVAVSVWYVAYDKPWMGNNVIGIAFCIQGIRSLGLESYQVGVVLLLGLFVYDVFWVFYTDVMVTVATRLDVPIKLLFPRVLAGAEYSAQFSMLGLGDIVIPGLFLSLMLKFDMINYSLEGQKYKTPDNMLDIADFPKPYFNTVMVGYVLGLVTTTVVMVVFKHAQPALLYLVPACILSSLLCALVRGEVSKLWSFTIEDSEEDEGASGEEPKDEATDTKGDTKKDR